MPSWAYLIIAIVLMVVLLIVFIVSFVWYKRTPAPKGCEHLGPNGGQCGNCEHHECHFNLYSDKKEEKK